MGNKPWQSSLLPLAVGILLGLVLFPSLEYFPGISLVTERSAQLYAKCPVTGRDVKRLVEVEGFDLNERYASDGPLNGDSIVVTQMFNEVCGADHGLDTELVLYFLSQGGRVSLEELGRIVAIVKRDDPSHFLYPVIIRLIEERSGLTIAQ